MLSRGAALLALLACATPAGAQTAATQRWHLDASGKGKVEVEVRLTAEQATLVLQDLPDPRDAVADELSRWKGIVAWTQVEQHLSAGKASTISAVGWFDDLTKVVPRRGHGWALKADGDGQRVTQAPRGRDATGMLSAHILFETKQRTFRGARLMFPLMLGRVATLVSVTQVVVPPGAPSDARRLTIKDGTVEAVIDLAHLTADAKLLFEAAKALRAEVTAKKRTAAEAMAEALRRLAKGEGSFRSGPPDPARAEALLAGLTAARKAWAASPWRARLAGARAERAQTPSPTLPGAPAKPRQDPSAFEPNDTRAQAKPLPAGSYPGLRLKREDWYRIETPRGHSLSVSASFFPAFGDIDLELYGADGKLLRRSVGRGEQEHIGVDPEGRPLWLRVWSHDRRWNQLQSDPRYTLTVKHVPYKERDALEPNDPPHPPREIGVGGHKDLIGDGLDVYRVKPAPAGTSYRRLKVVIRFAKDDDLDLELRDARGVLLAASRGTGETEQASSLEPPGGLVVRVLGEGRYTLEVSALPGPERDRFEPNDRRADARPIQPGRYDDLRVDTEDWYRLPLKAKRSLTVTATPAGRGEADLDLELYDAAGKLLRRSAGIGRPERLTLAGRRPGVVYVRVFAPGFARYALRIDDAPFRPADPFEPNETRGGARPITLGRHPGLRCTGEDWYRLPALPQGKRLVVEIAFDAAREGDLDLELYRGAERVAASRKLGGQERLEWSTDAPGALTLRVFGGTAHYRLTLEQR